MTDNFIDDAAKKLKNSQQDAKAEAETAQDHAEGKPSSETLNKANKYAIGWRLQTAKKQETKEKRIKTIIEMLSKGQKFH